jgi:hypothetical protein
MNTKLKVFINILPKVKFLIKQLKLKLTKSTGRPLSIPPEHCITLGIIWKKQNIKTKKSLHQIFEIKSSYKTLTVLLKKFALHSLLVLALIMKESIKHSHAVKHTDSTDIPVCLNKNAKHHRTTDGLSSWGHSGKGYYYGLKMNITTDLEGRLLGVHFAGGSGDDRKAFLKINKYLTGIFVADAGYISKELEREFYIENRRMLFAKPKANMKKLATELQIKLYDTRMLIEQHFRDLKLFKGLETSLPRSIDGYIANYIYSLLAHVLS